MPGKRVLFDDETWRAVDLLARDRRMKFQELAAEAFDDVLVKYYHYPDFKTALRESAKHPKERLDGKQRTHRRQPSHRRRQKTHATKRQAHG
jgi:hypothetical protein